MKIIMNDDIMSGAIMNLVCYGDKNVYSNDGDFDKREIPILTKIKIEPNVLRKTNVTADIIQFENLICVPDMFKNLTKIKIYYENMIVHDLPRWLIDFQILKLGDHKVKTIYVNQDETIGKQFVVVPLCFINKILNRTNNTKILFEFSGVTDFDIFLSISGSVMQNDTMKNKVITHGIYAYDKVTINNETVGTNILNLKLDSNCIGSDIVLYSPSNLIPFIKSIKIFLNLHCYIHYDKFDLKIYAKTYDNNKYMHLIYNRKNENDFTDGINYDRLDDCRISIEFDEPPYIIELFIATNTFNQTLFLNNGLQLRYYNSLSIKNIDEIINNYEPLSIDI